MLENGPVLGREARIYPDAGHCAFKYQNEWAPASFEWLAKKLKSLFPINDKEIHPIIVIKSTAINISKPGIL